MEPLLSLDDVSNDPTSPWYYIVAVPLKEVPPSSSDKRMLRGWQALAWPLRSQAG